VYESISSKLVLAHVRAVSLTTKKEPKACMHHRVRLASYAVLKFDQYQQQWQA